MLQTKTKKKLTKIKSKKVLKLKSHLTLFLISYNL